MEFKILKGQTLTKVEVDRSSGEDSIIFHTQEGNKYKMMHFQDCCEGVSIEDINGDWEDILNQEVLLAEERTQDWEDAPENQGKEHWGIGMWTFYVLRTVKGSVDIRWYGESNGYYSIGVSFISPNSDGQFREW